MFSELLLAVVTLGAVALGLLIMMRAITFEELSGALGRIIVVAFGAITVIWTLREIFEAFVLSWLSSLRSFFGWLVFLCLAIIALALIGSVAISKFHNRVAGSSRWEE